ncbi:MAG TPA: hypothetical protein VMH80_08010 [Bryobacteraceae bacterium]|nr:hypothetical protein [Bryobacteraceae bacterium]
MRHQLGEEENTKRDTKSDKTGSKGRPWEPEVSAEDDIDPADFFDPEEFGYRRRDFDARRP